MCNKLNDKLETKAKIIKVINRETNRINFNTIVTKSSLSFSWFDKALDTSTLEQSYQLILDSVFELISKKEKGKCTF